MNLALFATCTLLFAAPSGPAAQKPGDARAEPLSAIESRIDQGSEALGAEDLFELWSALDELRLRGLSASADLSEQQRRLRLIFDEIGWADQAAIFDEQSATALIEAGRMQDADQLLERGAKQLDDAGPRFAFYTAERADLARIEHNWDSCLALLDEADRALSSKLDTPIWYEASALAAGARGQAELFLGRLHPAWEALLTEREVLADFQRAFPEWQARTASLQGAAAFRRAEFKLFTGRHSEVIADVADALRQEDIEPGLAVRLRLLAALAAAEDEIWQPENHTGSATHLEELLQDLSNDPQLASRTALTLARLALTHEELDKAADWLDTAAQSTSRAPERERASLAALEGRLALAQGEPTEAALARLEDALRILITSWGDIPALPGGVGLFHDAARRGLFGDALAISAALGQPERGLNLLLQANAQGALARGLDAHVPSLTTLRAGLLDGGGALVFLPTFTRTFVLLLDAARLELVPIKGGLDLRLLVNKQRRLTGPARTKALAELATELLPPTARTAIATWDFTYITGAELLDHPPFGALPFNNNELASEAAIAFLPSLVVGAKLDALWPEPSSLAPEASHLFAALNPDEDTRAHLPRLTTLPISRGTLDELLEPLHGTFASKQPADREALLQAFAATSLLEVVCHGVYRRDRTTLPAGLALDTGLFFGDELPGLSHVPTLVALAVCGAGRGPLRRGEDGAGHLGGALLLAGARTVLISRQDLEVTQTLGLMQELNAGLADGQSPAEALRHAYANTGSAQELSLVAYGLAHRPLFEKAAPSRLPRALLVTVAMLLALGGFVLRRLRLRS